MLLKQVDKKNMYVTIDNNVMVSYNKIIVIKHYDKIFINYDFFDYSKTTAKHRNLFLNLTSKEFNKKLENGDYVFLNDDEMLELYYNIYGKGDF